jgi:ABC-type transport system involved in Fe-S cluster assembly fused permease/ATPase subunit
VSAYTIFTTKYSDLRQNFIKQEKSKSKALDFVINESMVNFEAVKYFNNESQEKYRYNYFLQQKLDVHQLIVTSLNKLNFTQNFIFNLGLGINLLLAVKQVQTGTMTVGDVFLIQTMFMSLQFPLNFLGTIYRELNESKIEINELFEILEIKSKVVEKENAKEYEYKGGQIVIEGVKYAAGKQIFDGVDIEIKPGSTNAIVGESGSGKSSLFRLMYRLFDPEEGRVLLDGQDLKDLKLDSIRKNIAIVPQNPQLFNDTIFYNVSYGNPNASKDQVIEACKLANIHSRILEFPDGYESLVGELGNKLSGGEKQRIALARCLLKDAKYYFLDEFTSAMDSSNELEILSSIKNLLKGKTVIYNSHRLSSITSVDKIFVLSDGKICENGTHNELLQDPNGKYSQAWKKFITNKG